MSNQALISAAILNAYWDKKHNDTLDLLIPFLKCTIAQITSPNEKINMDLVAAHFREEYGYTNIPIAVLQMMLKRLSPDSIRRDHGEYYLVNSFNTEVDEFIKKQTLYKSHIEIVINALKDHLANRLNNNELTFSYTSDLLYSFFQQNGLIVDKDPDLLLGIKQKDGRVDYEISRFILAEHDKDSIIFTYLVEMVRGFFMSTAISYQAPNAPTIGGKLKNFSCYIDTRIIIDALGLHLKQAKECAIEFLSMLKSSGSSLYCFTHNYQEIVDVISAYKYCKQYPSNYNAPNTLELFDEMNFTINDIDSYLSLLKQRVQGLGIKIVDTPSYEESLNQEALIDETGLEEILIDQIRYKGRNEKKAAQNDVNSVAAIMRLRNGSKPVELEKAKYIFVSSNIRYCNTASKFLNQNIGECIPAVMSEAYISAVLWLKNYDSHQNYPKHRLIENALASIEPNSQFLNSFYGAIEKLQAGGSITDEEAAIIRTDLFCKRQIMEDSQGDPSRIRDDTIIDLRDRLKEQYIGEERNATKLQYEAYIKEKGERLKAVKKALDEIQKIGSETHDLVFSKWRNISFVILGLLLIVSIACIVISIIGNTSFGLAAAIVSGLFELYGFFDCKRQI